MLRLPKSLLFPSLTHLEDVSFKNMPTGLKTGVFKLDWAKTDEIKLDRWKEQFPCSPAPVPFCGTLPNDLMSWVDSMRFALSEDYLQEIRHCSMKAAKEWDRKRPVAKHGVDPAVGPTISYVDSAFQLLSDCLFDPETHFYSRSGLKLVAPYVLSHRFWAYQTPPRDAKAWVNLHELSLLLAGLKTDDTQTYLFGTKIIQSLQNHSKNLEETQYRNKKEEARPAINMNLEDFLLNKTAEVTLQDKVMIIPNIGELQLVYPVNLRRSRGKIVLKAEFKCQNMSRMIQDLSEYSQPFDFILQNTILIAIEARIKNVSSNPPPEITIEFKFLKSNTGQYFSSHCPENKECSKIDKNKIEKAKDQELLALNSGSAEV
jgi:hypothetical protein